MTCRPLFSLRGDGAAILFISVMCGGTPEKFVETFIDEGKTDMVACMRAYCNVKFDGSMRIDHTPVFHVGASSCVRVHDGIT